MKIVGSQVILYVKDISESRNFYEKTLELPITYDGGEYWVTFDLGGTTLAIHPGGTGQDSADRTGISIIVDQIEPAHTEFNERGAQFGEILSPHPGVVFAMTRDPDGNPVFLKPTTE
jgi:catechol 2,3-dioxygenase-like lactoylglutathione lyase family enzyme